MSFASYITLLRILLIIPVLYFIAVSEEYLALILFVVAGLTDYLDGFIARKTKTETSLGAFFDLLADKLLVCLVLVWCAFISSFYNNNCSCIGNYFKRINNFFYASVLG